MRPNLVASPSALLGDSQSIVARFAFLTLKRRAVIVQAYPRKTFFCVRFLHLFGSGQYASAWPVPSVAHCLAFGGVSKVSLLQVTVIQRFLQAYPAPQC